MQSTEREKKMVPKTSSHKKFTPVYKEMIAKDQHTVLCAVNITNVFRSMGSGEVEAKMREN